MNPLHATQERPVHTYPPFLTVEEAAAIMRIGRTCAYQLARQFEATDGAEGMPVVRFGRQLRVPTARLEEWAGAPLSCVAHLAEVQSNEPSDVAEAPGPAGGPDGPAESPTPTPMTGRTTPSERADRTNTTKSSHPDGGDAADGQMLPFGS